MSSIHKYNNISYLLCLILIMLAGCGGGGNDSKTPTVEKEETSPNPNESFSSELANTATDITKQVLDTKQQSQFFPTALLLDTTSPVDTLIDIVNTHSMDYSPSLLDDLPIGLTTTEVKVKEGDCGGTYTTTSTSTRPDQQNVFFPLATVIEGIFDNYCTGNRAQRYIAYNGRIDAEITINETSFSSKFSYDVQYSSNYFGELRSGTLHFNETCTREGNAQQVCSRSSDYTSSKGTKYTVSKTSITGTASSGYNVSANAADDRGNAYVLHATNITLCSNSKNIQSGTITVAQNNVEILKVTFPSCNEFVLTYQGVSDTYSQNQQ